MAKGVLKDFWKFLWESESIWSYLADIIVIFILLKFIILPLIGGIFSVTMVIIESESMTHSTSDFNEWWSRSGGWYEQNNITKEQFSNFGFTNGMNKGDVIIVHGSDKYNIGDVLIFKTAFQKTPFIHRIVYSGNFYSTKGDYNPSQLSFEKVINSNQAVGKAIGRIPYVGWLKLIIFQPAKAFQ